MRTRPLLLAWLLVCGCGGMQSRDATAPRATLAPTSVGGEAEQSPADGRAEIERLERQMQANAAVVPADGDQQPPPVAPGVSRPPGAGGGVGEGEGARTCEQTCQATGSICQAAQRICALADDMDDDWARGRCRLASRTCQDTRRRATNHCGTC